MAKPSINPIRLTEKLTSEQLEVWNNIRNGFEEFQLIESGKLEPQPLTVLINSIPD